MKKTVLIFGLISGVLSSAMMLATVPFIRGGHTGYTLGYTAIVLSFLLGTLAFAPTATMSAAARLRLARGSQLVF